MDYSVIYEYLCTAFRFPILSLLVRENLLEVVTWRSDVSTETIYNLVSYLRGTIHNDRHFKVRASNTKVASNRVACSSTFSTCQTRFSFPSMHESTGRRLIMKLKERLNCEISERTIILITALLPYLTSP